MKRKGIILTAVFVLGYLCCGHLWATPTTTHEAEKVVKGWLRATPRPLDTALGRQITKIETYTDDEGNPLYYIVYLQPNGFAIVSADDLIEPIIGFVPEGIYDPSPTNPLGALVTADLNGRMESVRTGRLAQTKAIPGVTAEPQSKWNKFVGFADAPEKEVGTLGLSTINDVRVASFVQTRWDQDVIYCSGNAVALYNYYTPPCGDGQWCNYPCGCVATALAQIMRYFQWPNTGIGKNSFTVKVSNWDNSAVKWTRGGDGNGGAYSWADMVLVPGCGTTLAQRQAIAALCYDAGVAISNRVQDQNEYTFYNTPETTAYTHSATVGLKSTFKYSNAIYGYNGGSNITDVNGMVNSNLDALMPVCFGIRGSSGHQVVCDGYGYNTGTIYHHLNMGWAGLSDAWYALPNINSLPTSYNSVYQTIYNIYKLGSGEVISGRVTDPSGNPISGVSVHQAVYPGPNPMFTCTTNAKGIYAFAGVLSNTNFSVWADKTGYFFPSYPGQIVHTGHSTDTQATSGNLWGVNIMCLAPSISAMTPTSGPPGTYMKIQGTHFGSSPGAVIFPGVGYFGQILQWSDTVILCRVPFSPVNGDVVVQTSVGVNSTGAHFDITDPATIYVDANHTPDIENGTISYPFSTIERGIFAATGTDTVIVKPGTYVENISLDEVSLTLTSTDPNDPNIVASTVINGGGTGPVVTFTNNCSILTGFTITNGYDDGFGFGGAIFCNGQCEEAAPTISHCVITGNAAVAAGGGIYSCNSNLKISHCMITGNLSPIGGGIGFENNGYSPTIDHCIIVGNNSSGIYLNGGNTTISHSDISGNISDSGGGIFCATDVHATISHSILWADTAVDYGPEIFIMISGNPSVVTVEYSDVQGGLAAVSYPPTHPPIWGANNIDVDPNFVRDPNIGPDGFWGSEDDDYGDLHLSAHSPCIDAGDQNYIPDQNETDIDSQPRVVGCRVDIGADEFVYLGDIELNGNVDFVDFAVFAGYWQDTNCGKCGGADLTGDGIVDFKDLAKLAENWLKSLCKD